MMKVFESPDYVDGWYIYDGRMSYGPISWNDVVSKVNYKQLSQSAYIKHETWPKSEKLSKYFPQILDDRFSDNWSIGKTMICVGIVLFFLVPPFFLLIGFGIINIFSLIAILLGITFFLLGIIAVDNAIIQWNVGKVLIVLGLLLFNPVFPIVTARGFGINLCSWIAILLGLLLIISGIQVDRGSK